MKAMVETDLHTLAGRPLKRLESIDLYHSKTGGLLDEHVGAALERASGEWRQGIVADRDDDHVRRKFEQLIESREGTRTVSGQRTRRQLPLTHLYSRRARRARRAHRPACCRSSHTRLCRRAVRRDSCVLARVRAVELEIERQLRGACCSHRLPRVLGARCVHEQKAAAACADELATDDAAASREHV